MGGDCKSPGSAFEGSNPSPATSSIFPINQQMKYLNALSLPPVAGWPEPIDTNLVLAL